MARLTKEARKEKARLFKEGLKRCSNCGQIKELNKFNKSQSRSDGFYIYCKVCASKKNKEWRDKNSDRSREYHRNYQKRWMASIKKETKDKYKAKGKEWRERNKERLKKYNKEWNEKHKEHNKAIRKKRDSTIRGKTLNRLLRIRQRCNNPNNKDYKNYGAKGIKCLITIEELLSLFLVSDSCPLCGCLFSSDHTKRIRNTHRIDSSKDYTKDNIVIWCQSCHSTHHNKLRSRKENITKN